MSRSPVPRRCVDDAGKKKELWNKIAEAWFPGGPTDPDLALVQVRIVHANYWDVKSSKLVQLFAMAKAAVTGKPPGDSASTAKCACAEARHKVTRGIRRPIWPASVALFGAPVSARGRIVTAFILG